MPIAMMAALESVEKFKQLQSRGDYLQELRMKELAKKTGLLFGLALRIFPTRFHKYITYARSLLCASEKSDVIKNMIISGLCGLFVLSNSQLQRILQMYVIGLGVSYSMLLVRNMPSAASTRTSQLATNDPTSRLSISSNAFYTGAALTVLLGPGSAMAIMPLLGILPLGTWRFKVQIAMAISLLVNGYCSTYFECFESIKDNGSRWERARLQLLSEREETELGLSLNMSSIEDLEHDLYLPGMMESGNEEEDRLRLYEHINQLFGDTIHEDVNKDLLVKKPMTRDEQDEMVLGADVTKKAKSYSVRIIVVADFICIMFCLVLICFVLCYNLI